MIDTNLVDVWAELKRLRFLQHDADFEDRSDDAEFYKSRADYFQELIDKGIEYEPLF